jgi:hypothetical protein
VKKRCHRRPLPALPPRGLRPKLARDQVRDLALAHTLNLDLVATGQADDQVLWQIVGGVMTWAKAAELLGLGIDEMTKQLELVLALVQRYGRTGRVGFSGTEYQMAKRGVMVMDSLAESVDRYIAETAANWGEARVNELSAQCVAMMRSDGDVGVK